MLNSFIGSLFNLGLSLIARWGYFGLILGSAFSSMLIPIPSAATLGFSGYLVSTNAFSYNIAVLSAAIGNVLGSTFTYSISRYFGRAILLKYGKVIGVTESKLISSEKIIQKYGEVGVFISQILPVIGAIISVPAGITKLNYIKFAIYTFSGGAIWSAVIIFIGKELGQNWISIASQLSPFENIIKVILIIAILLLILRKSFVYYKKPKSY